MIRLVQLKKGDERRVAIVEEPRLRLLERRCRPSYELANSAIAAGANLSGTAAAHGTEQFARLRCCL